ncbi:Fc.00g055510.m01.CDS01 [Cosmosporella sp. VM-42]
MARVLTAVISQEGENLLQEDKPVAEFDIEEDGENLTNRGGQLIQLPGAGAIVLQTMGFLQSICWLDLLRNLGHFLTPSFLQRSEVHGLIRPANLYPTAFLDGMRGFAAFTVMIAHWSGWIYDNQLGWGAKGGHYDFLRLPFFCLLYHGSIQVDIFFVISGYVLSCRPMRFIRRGQVTEFHSVLTSLLFRRWARLFLPIAASTLMIAFLLQLGAYEAVRGFHQDKMYMTHRIEVHVTPQPTFSGELWHWLEQQWMITRGVLWGTTVDRSGLRKS